MTTNEYNAIMRKAGAARSASKARREATAIRFNAAEAKRAAAKAARQSPTMRTSPNVSFDDVGMS